MDYKEKYEKAVQAAMLAKQDTESAITVQTLEEIFPELRESEDEKIRKEIIEYIKTGTYHKSWIAWLEKQAEQKDTFSQPIEGEFPYTNPSNTLNGEIDNIWKKLSCGNMFSSNKNGFHEIIVHFANWFKNQSNKKWHYSNEKCMDNDALVLFHSNFDNTWNLKNSSIINWNVVGKWALLSDILSAEEKLIMTNSPQLDEQKHAGKVEPKFRVKYAGSEYNVLEVKDIAGVTYYGIEDEPNHIDYVQAENCERVGGYSIKENGSPYPTKPAVFSEQKTAWSEEDESMLNFVKVVLNKHKDDAFFDKFKTTLNDCLTWFRNIKSRVGCEVNCTTTKEWSEDDENRINRLIAYFEDKESFTAEDDVVYANWLKSLKERVQPQCKTTKD